MIINITCCKEIGFGWILWNCIFLIPIQNNGRIQTIVEPIFILGSVLRRSKTYNLSLNILNRSTANKILKPGSSTDYSH